LPNRFGKGRWEVAAAGDDRRVAGRRRHAHENGLQPKAAGPQAELIILGQAGPGERPPFLDRRHPRQRIARDSAADAGKWDAGADCFPDDEFLGVGLGKLVAIMTRDPARAGIDQRQDGQLDGGGAIDQTVEHRELERVDHVFRVVEHHGRRGLVRPKLVSQQRVVKMVEAVRLRRRPVRIDEHRLDPRVGDGRDRGAGQRIVPIVADENPVIGIVDPGERRAQHLGDHPRFVPCRNEDGEECLPIAAIGKGLAERPWKAAVYGRRPPQLASEINDINDQVVDGKQQKADAAEQRELGRNTGEEIGGGHRLEQSFGHICGDGIARHSAPPDKGFD